MKVIAMRIPFIVVLCLAVSGCVTRDAAPSGLSMTAATKVPHYVEVSGAAMMVRLEYEGLGCIGSARLRKVVGGQIDRTKFVEVGPLADINTRPRIEAVGIMLAKVYTADLKGLEEKFHGPEPSLAFAAIEPGDYVLTGVNCKMFRTNVTVGSDYATLFTGDSAQFMRQLGDTRITIKKGQIVDAGTLRIVPIEIGGLFNRKIGTFASSPADAESREYLKTYVPDLYRKITFTQFTK